MLLTLIRTHTLALSLKGASRFPFGVDLDEFCLVWVMLLLICLPSVVGQLRHVIRLFAFLVPLPHLVEEPLHVGGVRLDAEEGRVAAALPNLGAGGAEAKRKGGKDKLELSCS